jgi:hypothetical protein
MLDPYIVFGILITIIIAFSIYPAQEDPASTEIFEYEQQMLDEPRKKK